MSEEEEAPAATDDEEKEEELELERLRAQLAAAEVVTAGGTNETLAHRYYRASRNLTWTRGEGDTSGGPAQAAAAALRSLGGGGRGRGQHKRPAGASSAVPDNYVCHNCGEKGHHIRSCSRSWDFKRRKKVQSAAGLPRSWLKRISDEEVATANRVVFSLPDGTFAVLKDNVSRGMERIVNPIAQSILELVGTPVAQLEQLLRCPGCNLLFENALAMPCCGGSWCRRCCQTSGNEGEGLQCPQCHTTHDSVPPNTTLDRLVNRVLCQGNVPASTEAAARPVVAIAPGTIRAVPTRPGDVVPLGTRLIKQ